MIIFYPADSLDATRADYFFEDERQIAKSMGIRTILIDFMTGEVLTDDGEGHDWAGESVENTCDSAGMQEVCVYRGWQMDRAQYETCVIETMSAYGVPLVSPDQYETMHYASEYLLLVEDLTCKTMNIAYSDAMEEDVLLDMFSKLGDRVFVKDYVKSVRNKTWVCRRYNCLPVAGTKRILNEIKESRGHQFAGGYTFKEWLDIDEQVRVFVVGNKIACCVTHDCFWGGEVPTNVPTDLPSPFYVVDMAHDATRDAWYVLECDDGQMSECEGMGNVEKLYQALCVNTQFNNDININQIIDLPLDEHVDTTNVIIHGSHEDEHGIYYVGAASTMESYDGSDGEIGDFLAKFYVLPSSTIIHSISDLNDEDTESIQQAIFDIIQIQQGEHA